MKDRIKKLRKTLDMTQQQFADKIGVKRNTIAQYEIGRNEPLDTVINLICREFNVRKEWLQTGNGEMFLPKPSDVLDQLAYKYQISNADYIIIEKFLSLRPEMRKGMFDFFHEIAVALEGIDATAPAYGVEEQLPMNNLTSAPTVVKEEKTVEDLEEEYKKIILNTVSKKDSTPSNITSDIATNKKAVNDN